jgi:hypothetical protein
VRFPTRFATADNITTTVMSTDRSVGWTSKSNVERLFPTKQLGPRHGFSIVRWIRSNSDDAIFVEDRALYLRSTDSHAA